jgi:hypothetical protein
MKVGIRPCTSSRASINRSILEQRGYSTIERDGSRVTLPSGVPYDRVAALFLHGAPIGSALFLTLVSPAEVTQTGQDFIILRDSADLTCEQVGEIIREETNRGPQRSDPDEEVAKSLPTHFRITLPQIDEE